MIKYIFSAIGGYLLGSLNPASLLSKIKKKDLRLVGTKNLGATNVAFTFGKGFGALVMLFDLFKAAASYKIFELIFPSVSFIGMTAGVFAVVGHRFPFYLSFHGGKGLASFGGLVLAYSPSLFFCMLFLALVLMLAVNYGVAMPLFAAVAFPASVAVLDKNILAFLLAFFASILLVVKFLPNLKRARLGEDKKVREYIKKHM